MAPFLRRAAPALAVCALTACTTHSVVSAAATPRATTTTVASTGAPTTEASPPATISSLPDGVYRTSFGQAGSNTLTVKAGSYDLACGTAGDCGGTPLKWRPYLEVGALHGSGYSVWFVPDQAHKARLTGCIRHSDGDTGCGPEDPYRFTWQLTSNRLTFRDFFGLGDQAGQADGFEFVTAQAWTRIH